jgi:hypothetical protein
MTSRNGHNEVLGTLSIRHTTLAYEWKALNDNYNTHYLILGHTGTGINRNHAFDIDVHTLRKAVEHIAEQYGAKPVEHKKGMAAYYGFDSVEKYQPPPIKETEGAMLGPQKPKWLSFLRNLLLT